MTKKLYPRWIYYPTWAAPDPWVSDLVDVFTKNREPLDSSTSHKKSNEALAIIRNDLEELGYLVEGGSKISTIYRPVHFGEYGVADRRYQIDSYHPDLKVALEIEAGRTTRGNAIYRDIIQTSLLVGVDYFALGVPQTYSFKSKGKQITDSTYEACKSIFDAIYSSDRLKLPLKGVVLIEY